MRKFIYLLALPALFSATNADAQSFTMDKDSVIVAGDSHIDIYNNITNNTADTISVLWRVLSHTLPQSWVDSSKFGLCDNILCYDKSVLTGGGTQTDTFGAGKKCTFKIQVDVNSPAVTPTGPNPVYITAEVSRGSTKDTVTFGIIKWATNINKINNTRNEIILYPNPAANEVNVTFSNEMNIKNIAIYNLVGKQVSSYRVSGNSAKLNIEKIPAGIYLIRLTDNAEQVVATRRFTHQQ